MQAVCWERRDLSAWRYVYVWADCVYLQARKEPQAEYMLVLIAGTPEGKKELLGFQVGVRENAQSWRELLVDLKARGLAIAPELATSDGALGFWKALDEVLPSTSTNAAPCTRPQTCAISCPRRCSPQPRPVCARFRRRRTAPLPKWQGRRVSKPTETVEEGCMPLKPW